MNEPGRFAGTHRYLRIHWPAYLFGLGGGFIVSLGIILLSLQLGWWAFIPPALAGLLILAYFLFTSLWAAHAQFDVRQQQDHYILFEMGDIEPTERIAHVGLGEQQTAIALSRRLTGGHLTAIDIYNPQLTPGNTLIRMRRMRERPPRDPRLTWLEGSFNLLPLPDASVRVVSVNRTLEAVWQRGDQLCLLQEISRVLTSGGRLLVAERARSETNSLVMGPAVLRLPPVEYWQRLLEEAGFRLVAQRTVQGLVHYWRADKLLPGTPEPLAFDFGL